MSMRLNYLFKRQKKSTYEFCQHNLNLFLNDQSLLSFQEFFQQKNISVKEYHCLSQCEQCSKSPYTIANGEMVTAENISQLLIIIKEKNK